MIGSGSALRSNLSYVVVSVGLVAACLSLAFSFALAQAGGEIRGDSDGDGRWTARDAEVALRMSVGRIALDLHMDVDGDGTVDSTDAGIILQGRIEDAVQDPVPAPVPAAPEPAPRVAAPVKPSQPPVARPVASEPPKPKPDPAPEPEPSFLPVGTHKARFWRLFPVLAIYADKSHWYVPLNVVVEADGSISGETDYTLPAAGKAKAQTAFEILSYTIGFRLEGAVDPATGHTRLTISEGRFQGAMRSPQVAGKWTDTGNFSAVLNGRLVPGPNDGEVAAALTPEILQQLTTELRAGYEGFLSSGTAGGGEFARRGFFGMPDAFPGGAAGKVTQINHVQHQFGADNRLPDQEGGSAVWFLELLDGEK